MSHFDDVLGDVHGSFDLSNEDEFKFKIEAEPKKHMVRIILRTNCIFRMSKLSTPKTETPMFHTSSLKTPGELPELTPLPGQVASTTITSPPKPKLRPTALTETRLNSKFHTCGIPWKTPTLLTWRKKCLRRTLVASLPTSK